MENLVIAIYLALCVIGIIALVKFFQLCKDVRRIADKTDPESAQSQQRNYSEEESDERQRELDEWLSFKKKK